MSFNVEVKKKITVDGKEYESLSDVPPELRTAIVKTLAQGGTNTKTTVHINGKTYSGVGDLPAPLRAIVAGVTALAMKPEAEAVRAEPVLSVKAIIVAIGLAALLFWLARLVL